MQPLKIKNTTSTTTITTKIDNNKIKVNNANV